MVQEGRFTLHPSETRQLLAQMDLDQSGNITYNAWIASLIDWSKVGGFNGPARLADRLELNA